MKKTYEVLDLHYHEDEGQGCFDGTQQECEEFASTQSPLFMYKVVSMTKEQIKIHPDNVEITVDELNNIIPELVKIKVQNWHITDKYPCPKCSVELGMPYYTCNICNIKLRIEMRG